MCATTNTRFTRRPVNYDNNNSGTSTGRIIRAAEYARPSERERRLGPKQIARVGPDERTLNAIRVRIKKYARVIYTRTFMFFFFCFSIISAFDVGYRARTAVHWTSYLLCSRVKKKKTKTKKKKT